MKYKIHLSIVIPCLNEENNVGPLYNMLDEELKTLCSYELLWVDDGSRDNTLAEIKKICLGDPNSRFISFSRNFGHQNALKAGYDACQGDIVLSMDADLQHPISLIPSMISKWEEGYDVVNAIKESDNHLSFSKRITSKIFYKLFNTISDTKIEKGAGDFRLVDRKIINAINLCGESNPFFRGLIPWVGFKQVNIKYKLHKRHSGQSQYNYKRMSSLALSGITSFGVAPLRFSFFVGIICAVIAFIYMLYAMYFYFFTKNNLPGWTSILASVLFFSGIQLMTLGIIGEFIGKIFIESKRRPLYIVAESNLPQIKTNNI